MNTTDSETRKNNTPAFQSFAALFNEKGTNQVNSTVPIWRLEVGCATSWQVGHAWIHAHSPTNFALEAVANDAFDGSTTVDDPVGRS